MSSTTSFYTHAASLMNAATNDTNCDNPVPQGCANWAVQNNYLTSLGDAQHCIKVAPITQQQVNAARTTTSLLTPASVPEEKISSSISTHSRLLNFTKKTRLYPTSPPLPCFSPFAAARHEQIAMEKQCLHIEELEVSTCNMNSQLALAAHYPSLGQTPFRTPSHSTPFSPYQHNPHPHHSLGKLVIHNHSSHQKFGKKCYPNWSFRCCNQNKESPTQTNSDPSNEVLDLTGFPFDLLNDLGSKTLGNNSLQNPFPNFSSTTLTPQMALLDINNTGPHIAGPSTMDVDAGSNATTGSTVDTSVDNAMAGPSNPIAAA